MKLSQITEKWLREVHATKVKETTHKQLQTLVTRHLYRVIANLDKNVSAQKILEQINKIKPPRTRKRLFNVLKNSIDYAIICEIMTHNPCYSLSKYLKTSDYQFKPFAVLSKTKWPQFFKDIQITDYPITTKTLFWTLVYTALRRSEATPALKSEFDFKNGFWIIPGERMKNNCNHTVYLSHTMKRMLKKLFASNNSDYAFPSSFKKDKPLDNWAAYAVLKKAHYDKAQTLHGLRKIFSSHAHESGLFSIDAIELTLDHKISGVRGVYNLSKYNEERKQLALWYSDEIDKWRGIKK